MIGAGTVLNPILKIVTTVGILAAVSIFVIKPIIDTTETVSEKERARSEQIARDAAERSRQVQVNVARSQALSAAQSARIAGDRARARRIVACVRQAAGDPVELDFCKAR